MESFLHLFFVIFFLLSAFFPFAIFNYLALPYFFVVLVLLALEDSLSETVFMYITIVVFFIAFFLEIRLSDISFTINTPYNEDGKKDHATIKRLIIAHYIMILYVIISLSYYAYQAVFVMHR